MSKEPQVRNLEDAGWALYDSAITAGDLASAFKAMEFVQKIRSDSGQVKSPKQRGATEDASLAAARASVNRSREQ